MWSLILWSIAPIFNAIMDLTENENYVNSIFSKLNPKFWYKRESWNAMPEIPFIRYTLDAWHFSKTIMIAFMAASGIVVYFNGLLITVYHPLFDIFVELGLRSIIWGVMFSMFYNKIFRLKHAQN